MSLVLALACAPASAPILVFAGEGTSRNDVAAWVDVLQAEDLEYALVSSSQLDALATDGLTSRRLLLIAGGNFEEMGAGLDPSTPGKVRSAVRGGLGYVGVCAGAFLAGDGPRGLNLTDGVRFGFYGAEAYGIRKTVVRVDVAGAGPLDQYWEDGPELTGWGTVVGRYPDGTPAVVEGPVGRGFAVLSGTHPEAPDRWHNGLSSGNRAFAGSLVRAALDCAPRPTP